MWTQGKFFTESYFKRYHHACQSIKLGGLFIFQLEKHAWKLYNKEIMRTLALETKDKIGQEVLLKGWVDGRRNHGQIMFLDLRDRSCLVSIV